MPNKQKSAPTSHINQIINYAPSKDDVCVLSFPVSGTESVDVKVKKLLNTDEMASFVDSVVNALFVNDTYMPVFYDLVLAHAIIAYYTDLATFEIDKKTKQAVSLVSNNDLASLVYNTDIVNRIKAEVNDMQMNRIIDAIYKGIEFKKQEILNTQSARLEESIRQIEALTETALKFSEQFDGINMKQATEAAIKIADMDGKELVDNILSTKLEKEAGTGTTDQIEGQISFFENKGIIHESDG